jgi:hypothetical protein
MNQSNWTGRTPHTFNEAFGAHCTESISVEHTPMTRRDKWFVGAVLCCFALWVALMLAGVIAL